MNNDSYKYRRSNTPDEARWASHSEISQSTTRINLYDDDYPVAGLPIMSDARTAYVDGLDTHSLIFGATGSKKTRLFCMPMINMMAKAGESFIVTDPKGELYAQTSGLAKEKGYNIVALNFRDIGCGDRWNPLKIPYDLWKNGDVDKAGVLIGDFATNLASRQLEKTKDTFWPESGMSIAVACLYILMEAAKYEEINVTSLTRMVGYDSVLKNLKPLSKLLDKGSVPGLNFSSTVAIDANATISGMVSTLSVMTRIFTTNKSLTKMLDDSSFDMRMIGREKTAVYIIVPDEKTTYHFLVTTFVKQAYEILIEEAQKEASRQLPIRVNFVLDEFCNIPKIPDMPTMISAARSRNMRFYLVAQSLHQLRGRYGEDADTIKGNCDNWVFLTSRELDLLREVCALCGEFVGSDGVRRPLISVSQLQRLNKQKGEALIMHAREYPIITGMADISDYKMFGIYPTVPLVEYNAPDVQTFSVEKLMLDAKNNKVVIPFASKEYNLSQAASILNEERKALGISVSSFSRRTSFSSFFDKPSSKNQDDSTKNEQQSSLEQVARVNAHARIEALHGKAFADDFFKKLEENPKFLEDIDDLDDF